MLPYTALDGLAAMRASYGLPDATPERAARRLPRLRWFRRGTALAASVVALALLSV